MCCPSTQKPFWNSNPRRQYIASMHAWVHRAIHSSTIGKNKLHVVEEEPEQNIIPGTSLWETEWIHPRAMTFQLERARNLLKHASFVERHLPDLDVGCEAWKQNSGMLVCSQNVFGLYSTASEWLRCCWDPGFPTLCSVLQKKTRNVWHILMCRCAVHDSINLYPQTNTNAL